MSIDRIQWIFSKEGRIQYIYAIAIRPIGGKFQHKNDNHVMLEFSVRSRGRLKGWKLRVKAV